LPDISSAQVSLAFPYVAEALFGPEAFTPDRVCLREPIKRIVDSLVVAEWCRARKSVVKERNKIPIWKAEIDKGWQSELASSSLLRIPRAHRCSSLQNSSPLPREAPLLKSVK
jgi:hypothetical protein